MLSQRCETVSDPARHLPVFSRDNSCILCDASLQAQIASSVALSKLSGDALLTPKDEYPFPTQDTPSPTLDSSSDWSIVEPLSPLDILPASLLDGWTVDARLRLKEHFNTSFLTLSPTLEIKIPNRFHPSNPPSPVEPDVVFPEPCFDEDPFGRPSGSFFSDSPGSPPCHEAIYDFSIYEDTRLSSQDRHSHLRKIRPISLPKVKRDQTYPVTSTPTYKPHLGSATHDSVSLSCDSEFSTPQFQSSPKARSRNNRIPSKPNAVPERPLLDSRPRLRPLLLPRRVAARQAFGRRGGTPLLLKPLILPARVAQRTSQQAGQQSQSWNKLSRRADSSLPAHTFGQDSKCDDSGRARHCMGKIVEPSELVPPRNDIQDPAAVESDAPESAASVEYDCAVEYNTQDMSVDWEVDIIGEYLT